MKIQSGLQSKIAEALQGMENSMINTLGITITEVSLERVAAAMPVDRRTHQPFGVLHGGASVALAETLASFGGLLHIDTEQFTTVGQEINANHLRPVWEGKVVGVAEPLHLGKTSQVWQIEIRNDDGKLVCVSRCTLRVVPKS